MDECGEEGDGDISVSERAHWNVLEISCGELRNFKKFILTRVICLVDFVFHF